MSAGTPPRLVVDVQHRQQKQRPKPPKRPRGRWIWVISGAIMIALLGIPIARVFARAGASGGAITVRPTTHVITITAPVNNLSVQSYGSNIRVIGSTSARRVQVIETVFYDPQQDLAPAVIDAVSGGQLTLAAPACETQDCSVGFTVTVPSKVSVTAVANGGNVVVSGVAGANLDSGGGTVIAASVSGPLTVASEGGNQSLLNIGGLLKTDSGGGDVVVQGVTAASATITTDGGQLTAMGMATWVATVSAGGGDARIGFSRPPGSVDVTTDGGNATVLVPGGPYALTANSGGGSEVIGIATSPSARASLTITTGNGTLVIEPASGGSARATANANATFFPDQNAFPIAPPAPPAPVAP
jgi:hypothetical protein